MFPPPALVFTVAANEADGVGAAVDSGAAEAVADPAAGEAEDDAAVDDAAAPEDRVGSVCCLRADEVRLDEQPTTATAAKTAQAAGILTLVGRAMS
jgi:alpha-D-ribose 1-methylphosphonate 5-triphosphate diphosphatase PhnM